MCLNVVRDLSSQPGTLSRSLQMNGGFHNPRGGAVAPWCSGSSAPTCRYTRISNWVLRTVPGTGESMMSCKETQGLPLGGFHASHQSDSQAKTRAVTTRAQL